MPKTTHVLTNDVIVLGKVRELVIPHAGIKRKAVYENQRKSATSSFDVEVSLIRLHEATMYIHGYELLNQYAYDSVWAAERPAHQPPQARRFRTRPNSTDLPREAVNCNGLFGGNAVFGL